ncbi:hypothetical protein N7475_007898 [Penicillium sp. IBT 31633x]|nr:hypothetical protein N7475_007898 [Penicillium sp. IBT 31633x]
MGIRIQKSNRRVTKRAASSRKNWTEAFQEKLVQSRTCQKPVYGLCSNKPKSPHNDALQEALKCTECKDLHITPYMMNADITAGSYLISQYPPFFACKSVQDEYVSPLDTKPCQSDDATFWQDITVSQQQQYYDKIDVILGKTEAQSGKPIDEATVLFAHYQVDFHIRQHYLGPRSVLNLCRTDKEITDLNYWEWENANSDGTAVAEDPDWGVGWKLDPSNSIGHQIAAWRKGEQAREQHLADVKAQWVNIMEERRRQRMRMVHISFNGEPVRNFMYEPGELTPLTPEEVVDIASYAARGALFGELVKPL